MCSRVTWDLPEVLALLRAMFQSGFFLMFRFDSVDPHCSKFVRNEFGTMGGPHPAAELVLPIILRGLIRQSMR
ncbi:hypothetical protein B0H17DRAFT_1033540 [Mycena rosella]|uniref:Uncharacterized protein n=1 Tax=Mycena rosella TaxID=1033263 RepID=A0AAD7MAD6_MYCRO|nr:hypothetical protein B0H17DRAFT_1033540 [Mycena rosella]